ncbi:MAG TPA: hypothetical protein VI075_06550, partial [Methyloceanibacter sp.]
AACLALTMPPTDAAATEPEPGFAWMVSQYEGNVSLVYGSTESADDFFFFLSCNNQKKQAEMTVYQDIAGRQGGPTGHHRDRRGLIEGRSRGRDRD